jgi:hypothetical protein
MAPAVKAMARRVQPELRMMRAGRDGAWRRLEMAVRPKRAMDRFPVVASMAPS